MVSATATITLNWSIKFAKLSSKTRLAELWKSEDFVKNLRDPMQPIFGVGSLSEMVQQSSPVWTTSVLVHSFV